MVHFKFLPVNVTITTSICLQLENLNTNHKNACSHTKKNWRLKLGKNITLTLFSKSWTIWLLYVIYRTILMNLILKLFFWKDLEYTDGISCSGIRSTLQKRECPGFDTKLYWVVRFQFRKPRKSGVPLHCHYSQVHSDSKW